MVCVTIGKLLKHTNGEYGFKVSFDNHDSAEKYKWTLAHFFMNKLGIETCVDNGGCDE